MAPSSVVLQDEGAAKDDNAEEEEEKAVSLDFVSVYSWRMQDAAGCSLVWMDSIWALCYTKREPF